MEEWFPQQQIETESYVVKIGGAGSIREIEYGNHNIHHRRNKMDTCIIGLSYNYIMSIFLNHGVNDNSTTRWSDERGRYKKWD